MAKSGEFYTFDEVVRQLHIDENKLKRLVSEGEISAFREGDVMKFRKAEIDKLSTSGTGSETSETVLSEITLEDEGGAFQDSSETLTDDLVFEGAESDTGDQVEIGADAGLATEEISSQDTFIEEKVADDVGMTTEPIDLSADLTEDVEEEEVEDAQVRQARRPVAAGGRARVATAPGGNPGVSFALVLGAILGMLGLFLAWSVSDNEIGSNPPGNMATKLANIFYDMGSKEIVEQNIDELKRGLEAASTGG